MAEVEIIVYQLAADLYPGYPDPMPHFQYLGIEGKNLLESALTRPAQTFGGRFLYRTIFEKAAALLESMIKNHPFVDGNKRMGFTTVAVFMTLNSYIFFVPQHEAVDQCVYIAGHKGSMDLKEVSRWIKSRSIHVDKYKSMPIEQKRLWLQSVESGAGYRERLIQILDASVVN